MNTVLFLIFIKNFLKRIKFFYFSCIAVCFQKNFKYDNLVLHILFNSNCNAKCKFCNLRLKKTQNINSKIVYEYMKPLYPKTKILIPTFGEYTISNECYQYLSWIAKNYPEINIVTETNGINFDEKWQNFSMENLVKTGCSLNAINAKRYQETVWDGNDGEIVYNKIINNLKNYQKKLKENHLEFFGPRLSMVINPSNYCDIEEFVKLSLNLEASTTTFLFDYNYDLTSEDAKKRCFNAFRTLVELEALLRGKYFISFYLFSPFTLKEAKDMREEVAKIPFKTLRDKYADIYELAIHRNYRNEYIKKSEIRKRHNKKHFSLLDEFTACGSQLNTSSNCNNFCTIAYNHLLVYPNADIKVCPWEFFTKKFKLKTPNLNNFVKNNKINWNSVFNGSYYKTIRTLLKQGNYIGCPQNCPYKNNYFEEFYQEIKNIN